MRNPRHTQRGFTLVELLIALVIGSLLSGAVLSVFKYQADNHNLQEEYVTVEQNLRTAMEVLIKDLRMTGLNLADVIDPLDTGTLNLKGDGSLNANSNDDPARNGADALTTKKTTDDGLNIVKYQGSASNLRVCNPSDLDDGQILFLVNSDRSERRIIEITQINQISCTECVGDCDKINFSPGLSMLNSPGGLGAGYEGGTAYGLAVNSYFIEPDFNGDGTDNDPALMMLNNYGSPVALAFGINDLQIDYILEDGSETTAPSSITDVRMLRLTLEGTTRHPHKIGFGGTPSYRSRKLTTTVKVRNLGL